MTRVLVSGLNFNNNYACASPSVPTERPTSV